MARYVVQVGAICRVVVETSAKVDPEGEAGRIAARKVLAQLRPVDSGVEIKTPLVRRIDETLDPEIEGTVVVEQSPTLQLGEGDDE